MSNFKRTFGPLSSPVPLSYLDENFQQLEAAGTSTVTLSGAQLIGFAPSGSGAVAGTVEGKLQQVEVSVWDFMSTAQRADIGTASVDCAAAVASAVASLPATGGKVVIPGLIGIGAAGLALTSLTGVELVAKSPGAGFKILALCTSADLTLSSKPTVIRVSSCTRCAIRGLYIDAGDFDHQAVYLSACTEFDFDRNTIANAGGLASLYSSGGTRNRYTHNVIKDSDGYVNSRGMWIGNVGASADPDVEPLIHGNLVYNTGWSAIGGSQDGGVISNNRCILGGGAGIVTAATGSEKSIGVTVTGNYCAQHLAGIQVGDSTDFADYVEHITVTGNICELNDEEGILVAKARDCVISGNVCRDNDTDEAANAGGIYVITAKRLAITGNVCVDTRSGASRTQKQGISLVCGTEALEIEDVAITGNICRNNETNGIQLVNSGSATIDTVSITDNLVLDNGTNGIHIADSADGAIIRVLIADNTCLGHTLDIRCDPTDALVHGNRYLTGTGTLPLVNLSNVGNTGTGEDDLDSVVLPADTLSMNSKAVRITAWGSAANNANAKTLKLYFGSAVILTTALTAGQTCVWRIEALVFRTGASTQEYTCQLLQAGTATLVDVESGTAAQTDTAAITVKLTGEATDNSDIAQLGMIVERLI